MHYICAFGILLPACVALDWWPFQVDGKLFSPESSLILRCHCAYLLLVHLQSIVIHGNGELREPGTLL